MNSEERLKRSLEDLVNSKEFPFDEANWEKASEMIAASKKTRSRMIPLILGLIILTSGIGGFYMLNNGHSPASAPVAVKPSGEIKPALKRPSASGPAVSLPQPAQEEQAISTKPSAPQVRSSEAVIRPAEKEMPSLPVISKNTDVIAPGTGKAEPVTAEPAAPAPQLAASALPEKENTPAPETKPVAGDPVVMQPPVSGNTNTKTQPDADIAEQTAAKADNIPAGEHFASDQPEQAVKTDKTSEEAIPGNAEHIAVPVPEPAAVVANTVATEQAVEKTEPAAQSISSVALANEATQAAPEIDLGEIGKPKELPTLFSVEAGASYLYGWENPAGSDASGFNMVLGLNYFNHFAPKMAFSYGIQYTATGHLNFSSHTTKVTRLNLGEESRVTVFTPTKAHYLVVPLRFNYAVNPRNAIGIGCNAAYLLTVESEVEAYDQRHQTRGESDITKATGYTEGFNLFDVQASAFYRRRLYPNLSVNAEIFYGLSDVKNNTFFKLNAFERNTGIKLTLVYNILKK